MEISGLDFLLFNILSYLTGLTSGLIICCKNKDKFFVKSRRTDNLSQFNTISTVNPQPILASAPPPSSEVNKPVKITLE